MHRQRSHSALAAATCLLLVLFAGLCFLPGAIVDSAPVDLTTHRIPTSVLRAAPEGSAPDAVPEGPPPAQVKLAVLVVFDQLRGDYLERWDGLFGEGGFHRLDHEGAWFQNCHYPYSHTVTGAGHASVATGTWPRVHGVIGNEWFDADAGREVNCAGSDRFQIVPPPPTPQGGRDGKESRTGKTIGAGIGWPGRELAPSVGDALKAGTSGRGRVVALSLKDRGAVLPAGQHPDACYWFDTATGRAVTSTYYRDRPHPWAEAFNARRVADWWFGASWDRLRPDLDYAAYSGPDDVVGEGTGQAGGEKSANQGRVFPHPMRLDLPGPGPRYYAALFNSPFGNEYLLELAIAAIDGEQLGTHDAPDLLCVSFSSNDAVGHTWGPDSQEVLDVTLRSDRLVRRFLEHLDRRVGRGKYVVVLTADHGVCPLPEVARRRGLVSSRMPEHRLRQGAEAFLHKTFGAAEKTKCVDRLENEAIALNGAWIRSSGLTSAKVEAALAGWLRQQPGVKAAYTRTELQGREPGDDLGRAVWKSFHPVRSGDVLFVTAPYHFLSGAMTGTTHGTPHEYDTHVPLLAYGPGVRPGPRRESVTPQAAAAIVSRALGVPPPSRCETPLPAGLYAD